MFVTSSALAATPTSLRIIRSCLAIGATSCNLTRTITGEPPAGRLSAVTFGIKL
jgi:hypothetical protein